MGKAEENKQKKREALLNSAYELFTSKGINNTSISDIAEKAGVAKGTYYLYFKDKYDINTQLMVFKTSSLINDAMQQLSQTSIDSYKEKIIYVIDCVIDNLIDNRVLLNFITKNLGFGFYTTTPEDTAASSEINKSPNIQAAFGFLMDDAGDSIKNPELMLYMIIELVGSCIFNSITYSRPVPINELKPHLYETINRIIDQFSE